MRALGFCVSVAHAEYMAQSFNEAGIPARAVSGEHSADERERRSATCASEVNVLFAVDLFNEGLDVPDVDTVLFLRPTESATVFLQQLGRGLRRTRTRRADGARLRRPPAQGVPFRRATARSPASSARARAARSSTASRSCPRAARSCWTAVAAIVLENIKAQLASRWPRSSRSCGRYGDDDSRPSWTSPASTSDILAWRSSWTELRRCRPTDPTGRR